MDRFYCEDINEGLIEITGQEARHMASVKRLKESEQVELFDGAGRLAAAVIRKVSGKKVVLEVASVQKIPRPQKPRVIIAASPPKADRFDWMISKCTELGAEKVIPVIFERTVKQPKNPKAALRWKNIAVSACKQCGRMYLPVIDEPMSVAEVLKQLKDKADIYLGCPQGDSLAVCDWENNSDKACFIGPEGGLTQAEYEIFDRFGVRRVKLAENILRVETAAVAFAAISAVAAAGLSL